MKKTWFGRTSRKKYQDYVIKDSKFIGRFNDMYQKFEDPWNQTLDIHNAYSYSRNCAIINLCRYKIKSVVEFGCGLGYFTNLIKQNIPSIKIKGIDISKEAIKKAKKNWPKLDFEVNNVRNIEKYSKYNAMLFAEIMWYILDDLDMIFGKMLNHFEGKYFLCNLVFYKGQQKYGTEYFTNLKELIEYVPFQMIGHCEATTTDTDAIETSTIFMIKQK
ncbi:MAG: methyltransferase domain-containing protein [Thaumarchaeota archaeon]|nr:methyltransferase domain-containing protein [Nitrososphaerota archaeon]MBI3641816.1 methyltransferase domain-containing protein [Nitrososphaerota archaeon]